MTTLKRDNFFFLKMDPDLEIDVNVSHYKTNISTNDRDRIHMWIFWIFSKNLDFFS